MLYWLFRKQYKDITRKLNLELQYDPAIKLLGIYTKELILQFQRDISLPMIIAALFTKIQIWKQHKYSSGKFEQYFSAFTRKEILPLCNNRNKTGRHYAKQNEPLSEGQVLLYEAFKLEDKSR